MLTLECDPSMTDETTEASIPKWFKPVAIVALIWNLMGLMAFGMYMTLDDQAMEAAEYTTEQIEFFKTTPKWVNVAFAVGVVFGVAGSVMLVMRKKPAYLLLAFSMCGVLAQCTWIFFLSDAAKIMGVGLSPITIIVSIALTALSVTGVRKHWLT